MVAVVAGMSVGDPFLRDDDILDIERDEDDQRTEEEKARRKSKRGAFFKAMQVRMLSDVRHGSEF